MTRSTDVLRGNDGERVMEFRRCVWNGLFRFAARKQHPRPGSCRLLRHVKQVSRLRVGVTSVGSLVIVATADMLPGFRQAAHPLEMTAMLGRPLAIRQLVLATTAVLVAVAAVFQVTRSTGAAWCVALLGAVLSMLFASIVVRTMRQFSRFTAAVEQRGIEGFEPGSTPEDLGPFDDSFRRMVESIEQRIQKLKTQRGSLHERSRLLETVLSTMVEGVVAIDDSERVLFANESAKPLLDVENRDVVGRSMLEVTRSASVHSLVRETRGGFAGKHAFVKRFDGEADRKRMGRLVAELLSDPGDDG